jgi:hypothetical protein
VRTEYRSQSRCSKSCDGSTHFFLVSCLGEIVSANLSRRALQKA